MVFGAQKLEGRKEEMDGGCRDNLLKVGGEELGNGSLERNA